MSKASAIIEAVADNEPAYPAGCYYDIGKKEYLYPRPSGGWLPLSQDQFKRHLKALGYRSDKDRADPVSMVDQALNAVQLDAGVDYAGPLAGYMAGVYTMEGNTVLVTKSPDLLEPVPGEFQTIQNLLEGLLVRGSNVDQLATFYGWLKVGLESLYANEPRTGHVLMLAGPRNCGKSLLQNLLTVAMGGRSGKPYQFATGATAFNSDLFAAEHLIVEDEEGSYDMRTRRKFGAYVKSIAANETQRLHRKNREALTTRPHWRMTVSVNDDPEHLTVLPPLYDSILDKTILFKCRPPAKPLNDGTPAGRKAYWDRLKSELPAFIHMLLHKWEIRPPYIDEDSKRLGVKPYINPEIAEILLSMSDEVRLLNLIDMTDLLQDGDWTGTTDELERELFNDERHGYEAKRLLSWSKACGTYLGRLAKAMPDRVIRGGRDGSRQVYRITAG